MMIPGWDCTVTWWPHQHIAPRNCGRPAVTRNEPIFKGLGAREALKEEKKSLNKGILLKNKIPLT